MAGPDVKIQSMVEKEITVIENGQKVTKLVPVSSGGIASSLKLYFSLTITNEGDEVALNVVIDNPIPPGTVYAIGSATGEKGVVSCSVDDGVSFHSENKQHFNPGQCTDIRWVVDDMPPGSSCKLGFQVFVGSVATSFWTVSSRRILSLLSRFKARVRSDIGTANLELKDKPATGSRASFEARNLSSPEKEALAQSPEEIRRKLEARKNQTSGSRAIFTAKDIEPIVPPKPK